MKAEDMWDCTCGHGAEEHHHDPSGISTSHCEWSERVDEYGFPAGEMCPCNEYEPNEPCYGCGHLLVDHVTHEHNDVYETNCEAMIKIMHFPERMCDCTEFLFEEDAAEAKFLEQNRIH